MIAFDIFAYATGAAAAALCMALLAQWGRAKAYQVAECFRARKKAK